MTTGAFTKAPVSTRARSFDTTGAPIQKTTRKMRFGLRPLAVLMLFAMFLLSSAAPSEASHFRYGNLSWQPTGNAGEIKFNFTGAFRRSSYGSPVVGSIFTESQGGTTLNFGDGSSTGTLQFRVIAFSAADDYVIGEALNPGTSNAGVLHTYTGAGPYTNAGIMTCCRVAALSNRSNANYSLTTTVSPLSGNSSPVSSQIPIVTVAQGPASTFTVSATDPNGDGIRFRLSTEAEAGGGPNPPGMVINPNSGVVTWNTVGLSTSTPYTVQVIIEDLDLSGNVKTSTPVDFLLKVTPSVGTPPSIAINPPGPFNVLPGDPISFTVSGADVDSGSTVTLNTGGLPTGATMSPGLPISGAGTPGVSSTFNWTPAPAASGSYVVTFSVTDNSGAQVQGSAQIVVSTLPPPDVATTAASNIVSGGATLNGTVNPQGVATTYRFEYGTSTAYGNSTPPVSAGAGSSPLAVSSAITGLPLNTVINYRLVASSAGGTSVSPNATFLSAGLPNIPPSVTLTAPSNPTTISEVTPVTFSATAADSDGTVTKVDFYADGTLIGTDNTAPYEINAGTFSIGTYVITAVATDDDGDTTLSNAATLVVVEATPVVVDDHAFVGLTYAKMNPRRNDSGPGALPLTIVAVGGSPTKGTASIIEGGARVLYSVTTPLLAHESDSFTYTVRNSIGREATATVTVHPAPAAGSQFVSLLRDHHGEVFGVVTYYFVRTGTFTGTITYNGRRYGFRGGVTGDSPLLVNVKRGPTVAPLPLDVGAGPLADGSVTLASEVLDPFGDETWSGNAVLSPYSLSNRPVREGYYTLAFDADPAHLGDSSYPQGGTGLSVRVTPSGAIRIVGRAPDGTGVSNGSYLLTGDLTPFYLATGSTIRRGKWHGDIQFTTTGPELTATSEWTMPGRLGASLYPGGFTVNMAGIGCAFTRPSAPSGILSGPNIRFDFADAGFVTPFSTNITFGSDPLIAGPAPLVITRVGRVLGTVGGQIRNPNTGTAQSFFGVVLQHPSLNRIQGTTYNRTGIGSFGGVVLP